MQNSIEPGSLPTLGLIVLMTLPALAESPPDPIHQGEPIPELIWENSSGDGSSEEFPGFVSADRAVDAAGKLSRQYFSASTLISIERSLHLSMGAECREASRLAHDRPQDSWMDFESIARSSEFIVIGRITGTRKGIRYNHAGTLLKVEPERWLKGRESWTERYLLFRDVRMTLGEREVCWRDPRFPEAPELGARVLISYGGNPHEKDSPFFFVQPAQIIILPAEGTVHLPKFLSERHPDWSSLSSTQLIQAIEDLLDRTKSLNEALLSGAPDSDQVAIGPPRDGEEHRR